MLGHRLRRWPNIKILLGQRVVFSGYEVSPVSLYGHAFLIFGQHNSTLAVVWGLTQQTRDIEPMFD